MVDLRNKPETATPASGATLGLPQAIALIVGAVIAANQSRQIFAAAGNVNATVVSVNAARGKASRLLRCGKRTAHKVACSSFQRTGRPVCASGLRVPKPYGDYIMLDILKESGGVAVAFSDEVILESLKDWAKNEGIFLSPEGAAATAAYDHLLQKGFLKTEDRVVLFNTGAGLKYTDVTAEAAGIRRSS